MKMVKKNMKLSVGATRYSNRPGCKGKIMIRTEGEAKRAVDKYKAQFSDDETIEYYHCTSCNEFHLGHTMPDPKKLEVEAEGRFLIHDGLTFAKVSEPGKIATFWVFMVPKGTAEDEAAVLEKGVMVAYKEYRDIWREKGGKRSDLHQVFFLCPTMNYLGSVPGYAERLKWHKENMGDLLQTKMDLLNGVTVTATLGDVAPEIEAHKAKLVAEQEMYKGRAVFRTEKGKPYHRSYYKCTTCPSEIELRAYICQDANGNLTTVRTWAPVDPRAVPRPSQTAKRNKEWVCGDCMGKVTGMQAEAPPVEAAVEVEAAAPPPAAETVSFVESLRRKALEDEPPEGYVESCSYCGLPGHWRADCPEIGAMIQRERHVQRQKQEAYAWTPPVAVVQNLQKIAENGELSAEFVRGAALLACHILTPGAGEFRL